MRGDVAQPHGRSVRIGAQRDRAELFGRGKLALDQHQRGNLLLRRARLGADAAGGDLRVLGCNGLVDVVGGEAVADELCGIDPDPQRTFGRIERGAADAGNAPDFAEHVADHEIAEADFVERAVGRVQRDDLQHGGGGFLDQDALLDHRARQPRLDALEAVLHFHRGRAGFGAGHEVGDDLDLPQRVRGGFEIEDAGGAVELLLDQPRDAVVEVFRRRAGIAGRDRDRGRRDDRILRDRQQRNRDRADQTDEKRDDPGEDRPVNEEARAYPYLSGPLASPVRPVWYQPRHPHPSTPSP